MNIAIIGSGNVGGYFLQNFRHTGWDVRGFSRTPKDGFHAISDLIRDIELYDLVLICVSDNSIAEVSGLIPASEAIVAHVSGATAISTIHEKHSRRAVVYPLMSIRPDSHFDISTIPFCLEASDPHVMKFIKGLMEKLHCLNYPVNSDQRKYLHLAAVFSQNFSNHLYQKAWQILKDHDMDFKIILPLLHQSLQALDDHSPAELQTGPAIRNDQQTMEKHLQLLELESDKDIYTLLSKSIQQS